MVSRRVDGYTRAGDAEAFVMGWLRVVMGLMGVWLGLGAGVARGQALDLKTIELMQEMAEAGPDFKAEPLHAMGVRGVGAVLDRLLPDAAGATLHGEARRSVDRLIAQLGDASYRQREAATGALLRLGPAIRPVVVAAVDHDDAEIGWRARRILRQWQREGHGGDQRMIEAFAVYLREVDDPACLEEIARRTVAAMSGPPASGPRWKLLNQCLTAIGRSGDDRLVGRLAPLLEHDDVRVAVRVVEMLAAGSGPGYFPELLFDAMRSGRTPVVAAAVDAAALCQDEKRREQVERRLVEVFERGEEGLRSFCALPLARDFGYGPAEDHLLGELNHGDPERRDRVLRWIGDPANLGRPASDKLAEALKPLLGHADYGVRREACKALAMYGGENVVRALIPLLGDSNASFANQVAYRLDHQRDKAMLRRLLGEAANNHPDEKVRAKAAMTLKMLDRRAREER